MPDIKTPPMVEQMTDYLPQVRCTPSLKQRLEQVADESVTANLADHIRFAVERYVAAEEARRGTLQAA
jgi:predicted transcriptional regulator